MPVRWSECVGGEDRTMVKNKLEGEKGRIGGGEGVLIGCIKVC